MSDTFKLRYASHLGFLSPERPQFLASVGSADVRAQVEYAAGQGMSGIFHPWAPAQSPDEIGRFGQALSDFGLQCGGLVFAPMDVLLAPHWVRSGDDSRQPLAGALDHSASVARDLNASTLVVLLMGDEQQSQAAQWSAAVERLRWAGDRVAHQGLTLAIEPMIVIPGMFLQTIDDTVRLLDEVAHPAVKLVFDTAHVSMMSDDLSTAWARSLHHVGPIQISDMPGRNEPGTGNIDFVGFLNQVIKDGRGDELIELEFDWSDPSAEGEQAGVAALHAIDSQVAA
ncbi:MAG TPA: TIM barrel protein [Sphingobium sp.]|nr:TIM barrel protein [Sphingobium sp.]